MYNIYMLAPRELPLHLWLLYTPFHSIESPRRGREKNPGRCSRTVEYLRGFMKPKLEFQMPVRFHNIRQYCKAKRHQLAAGQLQKILLDPVVDSPSLIASLLSRRNRRNSGRKCTD